VRLEWEEMQREELRQSGRHALQMADVLLQSVEQSLEKDSGALSARPGQLGPVPLPPIIQARPDTADQ
jgi:hypothetical protein